MELEIITLIHKSPHTWEEDKDGEPYISVRSLLKEIERQTREGNMYSTVNMCRGFNAALFLFDLKTWLKEEIPTRNKTEKKED